MRHTCLTPEESAIIIGRLRDLHQDRLGNATFALESELFSNKFILRLTLSTPDRVWHYPMEAGCSLTTDSPTEEREKVLAAVDFLGHVVAEYLESGGERLLPLDWMEFDYLGTPVFARGWERNALVEDAADRLLAGETLSDAEVRDLTERTRARRMR